MSGDGIHVEREGEGPDIVLLHGWAMHGGLFAPLSARLRERYTVHRVDLPGHGASLLPLSADLDANVDALAAKLPRALWLGWSLGGLFALRAAVRHADKVAGLAMLAANPRFVRADDWTHGVDAGLFRSFGRDLREDWRGTVDRFLALEAHGSDHLRAELRTLRALAFARGEPDAASLDVGLQLLETTDLRDALAALGVPSTWIAGRRDRLVPPQAMQAAASLAGRADSHVIAGAGHAPFLSHADRIAGLVEALASRCGWDAPWNSSPAAARRA